MWHILRTFARLVVLTRGLVCAIMHHALPIPELCEAQMWRRVNGETTGNGCGPYQRNYDWKAGIARVSGASGHACDAQGQQVPLARKRRRDGERGQSAIRRPGAAGAGEASAGA